MTPSEAAQRYALALPGVWLAQNNGSFSHFGGRPAGPANRDWAQGLLEESWDVGDKDSLLARMKWLADEGHSSEYFEWKKKWAALPADQRESDLRLIHVGVFQQEIGDTGLVAWDQVRRINLAGWGFLAGYLTEEEAWDHIIPAAQRIQKAYPSWEAFARGYMVGTAFWSAPRAETNGQVGAQLASDPQSPWAQIPWNTPLGAGGGASAAASSEGGGMGWLMYVAGCLGLLVLGGLLLVVVVVVVLFGGSMMAFRSASVDVPEGVDAMPVVVAGGASDWDGSAPFVCQGSQKKTISGVTAKLTEGPAVLAQGSCELTIVDSTIEAPVALELTGSAKVTMQGGAITGSDVAIQAGGASKSTFSGTQVTGKVVKKGAATIEGL